MHEPFMEFCRAAWGSLGGIRQRVGYAFRFLDHCVVDFRLRAPQLFKVVKQTHGVVSSRFTVQTPTFG